jgi:hypothetical protein
LTFSECKLSNLPILFNPGKQKPKVTKYDAVHNGASVDLFDEILRKEEF